MVVSDIYAQLFTSATINSRKFIYTALFIFFMVANIAVIGMQWGDEGKGKIIDFLAEKAEVVARFNGGNNAGHTINAGGRKIILHTIPSGILHSKKLNIV